VVHPGTLPPGCVGPPGHDGRVEDVPEPLDVVTATAPIRICDTGGWTDTWFAGHGKVCNIAVNPRAVVRIRVHGVGSLAHRVIVEAKDLDGEDALEVEDAAAPDPLIQAIVDEMTLPDDLSLEVSVSCGAPPGSSTGTSAAVAVALIGALDAVTPGCLTPDEVAYLAHRTEVERLGNQSGVQDQLCAAHGGVSFIAVDPYPHTVVTHLALAESVRRDLDRRLVLVYLGRPHASTDVHDRVIAGLAADPGQAAPVLDALRGAAEDAKNALLAGDLVAFGQAMTANTEAQRQLHPGLVDELALTAMELARAHGALGWKVNGAGGEGGSLTVLCGTDGGQRASLIQELPRVDPLLRVVPISLSHRGLLVRHR
jgi:D-glycero-alpha-D-manno-heptose-7-phosphate kinase